MCIFLMSWEHCLIISVLNFYKTVRLMSFTILCRTIVKANFSSGEVVAQCHISSEGKDGDENRGGGPEVDTEGIQILATSQAL